MRSIEQSINAIPNAEVLNIWGHKDMTLEEVAARIKVNNTGEIVLGGLSEDSFNYPEYVGIKSIGGLHFKTISCGERLGVGSSLDIGNKSEMGNQIGIEFTSVEDVVNHYDDILAYIHRGYYKKCVKIEIE